MYNIAEGEKIMDQLLQKLQKTAEEAEKALENNNEWINRYAGYASEIMKTQKNIKNAKKLFRERKPLYLYSSISKAKNNKQVTFDLRYRGQSVAEIVFNKDKLLLKTNKKTKDYYDIEGGGNYEWNSKKAEIFRSGFKKCPDRDNKGKKNEEHRFESELLTELSKDKGSDKLLMKADFKCRHLSKQVKVNRIMWEKEAALIYYVEQSMGKKV